MSNAAVAVATSSAPSGQIERELTIGARFESQFSRITQEMIQQFAENSLDFNPIHIDPEYARATGFHSTVAHGALVFSRATGLFWSLGIAQKTKTVFRRAELEFRNWVYAGDSIRLVVVVKNVRTRRDITVLTFDLTVENQHGQAVQFGTWTGYVQ